jgi:hypothetical protein
MYNHGLSKPMSLATFRKFVFRDEAQGAAQRMTRHTIKVGEE